MDFYNPGNVGSFLIDRTKWWWLPNENGGATLVVSVRSSEAARWVVAYTILISLIFMALSQLATIIVLGAFTLGDSGTCHAMLVSYYNQGDPMSNLKTMLGYCWNALWRCERGGNRSVDWNTLWASIRLAILALTLASFSLVTQFLVSGENLIVAQEAQVNPNAVFYPAFVMPDPNGNEAALDGNGNLVPPDVVDAFKGLIPQAIYQANARKTNAAERLKERIQFSSESLVDGALMPDGSHQNGTGARFEYQYSLTGFEMGLRDAPKLTLNFQGACATYHGSDGVLYDSFNSPDWPDKVEELNIYPFYGNQSWPSEVIISRDNYTAPWAYFNIEFDPETLNQNEQYGGYTFMIVPNTAWRLSSTPNPKPDPWYETEENPWYDADAPVYYPQYRVKSARPAMRCTQNDTYTYDGKTVNHVSKLSELQGLKLSPFIRDIVFGREFGSPVFSKLLGNLPFGTLASTAYFDPNQRRLDVTRVSLDEDFKGLVYMAFVYSREVVRNTVLLYSLLQGRNDTNFYNAATLEGGLAKNADFFLEGSEVSAMSVHLMIAVPSVCAFLWILVWLFTPSLLLNNKGFRGRYALRLHGFLAVHLFRFLDEELSRERKWSGRNTDTPYIRDLDIEKRDLHTSIPASVYVGPLPKEPEPMEKTTLVEETIHPKETTPREETTSPEETTSTSPRSSQYAKPKVLPVQGPKGQRLDVAITRAWDKEIGEVKLASIPRNVKLEDKGK